MSELGQYVLLAPREAADSTPKEYTSQLSTVLQRGDMSCDHVSTTEGAGVIPRDHSATVSRPDSSSRGGRPNHPTETKVTGQGDAMFSGAEDPATQCPFESTSDLSPLATRHVQHGAALAGDGSGWPH